MTMWTHFRAALALAVLLSFAACITTTPVSKVGDSDPDTAAETEPAPAPSPSPPVPPSSEHWTLISDKPSSYFPKGLPKDAPTNHLSGEWVHSGDRSARWFVPKGGIGGRSENELQAEALSLRTQADEALSAQSQSRGTDRGVSGSRLSLPFRKAAETTDKVE